MKNNILLAFIVMVVQVIVFIMTYEIIFMTFSKYNNIKNDISWGLSALHGYFIFTAIAAIFFAIRIFIKKHIFFLGLLQILLFIILFMDSFKVFPNRTVLIWLSSIIGVATPLIIRYLLIRNKPQS